jgi:hypothetical protein
MIFIFEIHIKGNKKKKLNVYLYVALLWSPVTDMRIL